MTNDQWQVTKIRNSLGERERVGEVKILRSGWGLGCLGGDGYAVG